MGRTTQKSVVVSFKLPLPEYKLCFMYMSHTEKTWPEFLKLVINEYLEPTFFSQDIKLRITIRKIVEREFPDYFIIKTIPDIELKPKNINILEKNNLHHFQDINDSSVNKNKNQIQNKLKMNQNREVKNLKKKIMKTSVNFSSKSSISSTGNQKTYPSLNSNSKQQKKKEKKNQLELISVRLPRNMIEKWDSYCEIKYITRTSFFRQAINTFFTDPQFLLHPPTTIPNASDLHRLFPVINNLIHNIGLVDFFFLADLFEGLDDSVLNRMLSLLEAQGKIGRKGRDTYVPANPMDAMMGTLFVAENLNRITTHLQNNPDEWENPEYISLTTNLFRFLWSLISALEQDWRKKNTKDAESLLKKLQETMSQLMDASLL